jgi:uncharacterized protein involved in response to NO
MMALISIHEPAALRPPPRLALFELGFRPFYLAAALWAIVAIVLWLAELHGHHWRGDAPPGLFWHGHEMIFGFASATVAGFTLTAVRNWTQQQTARGPWLAALALLWLAGRLAMLSGSPAAAIIDILFLPALAVAIAMPIVRVRQWRNIFLPLLLLLLAACNLAFQLAAAAGDSGAMADLLHAALFVLVMLETVIGGRVIPGFTANALPGVVPRRSVALDRATIAASAIAFVAALTPVNAWIAAAAAATAGVLQAIRLAGWKPWRTARAPLLWVLHLGYAWIALGMFLLAAGDLGWLPISAAIHAFAVGSTGGLIIGMMTRTARGHTARPLLPGGAEVAAYALVALAALDRVAITAVPGLPYAAGLDLAGGLWCAAFALFVWRYLPWLMRPRLDGQRG